MSGLLHYVVTYVWEGDIIYTGESKEYGAVTVRASMPKYCETFTFSIGTFACTKHGRTCASVWTCWQPPKERLARRCSLSPVRRPGRSDADRVSKSSSIGAYFDTNGVLAKEVLEADVDSLLAQLKAKSAATPSPSGAVDSSSASSSESSTTKKTSTPKKS
jgi:hypothetical protein